MKSFTALLTMNRTEYALIWKLWRQRFINFIHFAEFLEAEKELAEARLALAVATKSVIKNGLVILGVDAPEKM